ncbi:MAG: M48 family metalloprotease [Gammaproteobacteria bacterium]|nr:M48 family metalloprotease [Gammaproteobacteria bacterium]
MKIQYISILTIALFMSCRSRENTSETKHIAGELKRDNIIALNNGGCPASGASSVYFGNPAPQPQIDYLKKIFKKIVDGSPDAFTGPYAPENFCIRAYANGDINAFASPNGTISFLNELIKVSTDDSMVASVMAHEAAHILLQHSGLRAAMSSDQMPDHPRLEKNPEWISAKSKNNAGDSAELKSAKNNMEDKRKLWDKFIGPIRNLLSPATRDLKAQLETAIEEINKKISKIDAQAKAVTDKFEEFKRSAAWTALTDQQKTALEAEAISLRNVILDTKPKLLASANVLGELLVDLDAKIDEELSRALTKYVGGVLGSAWKKVNKDYQEAKQKFKEISEREGYVALMKEGSRILNYDYVRENWMEAEADQAGLELLIRAGFTPSGAPAMERKFVEIFEPQNLSRCDTALEKVAAGDLSFMPNRGRSTHPASCWRRINTAVTELQLHREHFAPNLPTATQSVVFPGELDAIKKL